MSPSRDARLLGELRDKILCDEKGKTDKGLQPRSEISALWNAAGVLMKCGVFAANQREEKT
jgi:hypothetical protein